jgi:hypothetical protein
MKPKTLWIIALRKLIGDRIKFQMKLKENYFTKFDLLSNEGGKDVLQLELSLELPERSPRIPPGKDSFRMKTFPKERPRNSRRPKRWSRRCASNIPVLRCMIKKTLRQ